MLSKMKGFLADVSCRKNKPMPERVDVEEKGICLVDEDEEE